MGYIDKKTIAMMAADRILESVGLDFTTQEEVDYFMNTQINYLPDYLNYANGASRLTIWDDYCDFVVKIPLIYECEKYNDAEVGTYRNAKREGVEEFFAWCDWYREPTNSYDDYVPGIIVMEYADCDEGSIQDEAITHGYKEYLASMGADFGEVGFEYYSAYNEEYRTEDNQEEILQYLSADVDMSLEHRLNEFIFDYGVNDIHYGNIGRLGESIIIVDYAGWGW